MMHTAVDRRALLRLAALALVPAAAGCSSLIPGTGTPSQIYVLMRKTTFPPDLPSISRQLLVGLTRVANQLERDPALFRFGDRREGYRPR